jgi:DNA-binding PadR family transcriptional regulator
VNALETLDPVIHAPARLAALGVLRVEGELAFAELKLRLESSDGALGIHLQKLEVAGYVRSKRDAGNGRPRTLYALTPKGSKALADYLDSIQRFVDAMRTSDSQNGRRK